MLVLFNSYKMNTNEIRIFQKPFAIGTGQVPVRKQRQIIKLQNKDSLNVSADRNIEQIYGNLLETFNAIKTFTKKALTQCFSTAGPWHQLYRAARGLKKLQYATRFH